MSLFLMMCLNGYFRPGELMDVRAEDMIAPMAGGLPHWSVLLFPEERRRSSKVGEFNDTVVLDSARLKFLDAHIKSQVDKVKSGKLWRFSYPQFVKEFQRSLRELRLEKFRIVPYQLRHSGPSIDLARGTRSLLEAQKRGRWGNVKSMSRYERHGRLNQDWGRLTASQRNLFSRCEEQLEAAFRGVAVPCHLAELA